MKAIKKTIKALAIIAAVMTVGTLLGLLLSIIVAAGFGVVGAYIALGVMTALAVMTAALMIYEME